MGAAAADLAVSPAPGTLADYLELTKPAILMLVVVTAIPTMMMAAHGFPTPWLLLVTLVGLGLASASASTFNCVLDRDIDAIMKRTRHRPLPAGRLTAKQATLFGALLAVASFVLLAVAVNMLTALLAMGSIAFYVGIYTGWLKRTTPQNIVIGGAAGAVGPIIGWSAVTNHVGVPALVLFMVIFLWTPPHFWAIALYRNEDYTAAGVPMYPVVHGEEATRLQILLYTLVMIPATLILYPLGQCGMVYMVAAIALGAVFASHAVRVYREGTYHAAVRLFRYSLIYLFLLFLALMVDTWLRFGTPWAAFLR